MHNKELIVKTPHLTDRDYGISCGYCTRTFIDFFFVWYQLSCLF